MVPEFGATEHIRCYPAGDADALVQVVTACYEEKLRRMRLVQDRTWDRWAETHHDLFSRLLQARGLELPRPGPAFRFGMLSEMDVPLGADVADLETAVDRAAAHLYFGENGLARSVLQQANARFPCVQSLLKTLPNSDCIGDGASSSRRTSHIKALR